jgi:glycerol-3-phosphate dehydrogenase
MRQYVGEAATRLMSSLKTTVDPDAVMNPTALVESEKKVSLAPRISGAFSYVTRSASLDRYSNQQFDLVIIGGGITGAGIARDAAIRGMKVALLDKRDFAGGTSSKSSGMVHGGLRYLRQLDIKMVKESLREREALLHLAPHLVQPRPHLIPSYKGQLEKLELQIGMIGYDLLAASKSLPRYQKLSDKEVGEREPLLKKSGLRGGFVYYDCLVNDARLTLATLKSAAEHGAAIANYVSCVGLEMEGGAVKGLHFEDVLGGGRGTIHAKVVVNATGSWTDTIRAFAGETKKMLRPTKGVHLVVRREALKVNHIIVMFTPDNRIIFVVPFGRSTYIGTTDTDYSGPLDAVRAEAEDVSYLLNTVNEAFEDLRLTECDVVSTWAGLRPLLKEEGRPSSISRDYEIAVGDNGLVSIAGGKLTTHRAMAEALLDEVLDRFGEQFEHPFSECQTADLPLYGGDIADFEKYAAGELKGLGDRWGLSPDVIARLVRHYGTDYLKILSLGLTNREFLDPLSPDTIVLKGEVIYAVEDEMTMSLEDFLERRTDMMHFDPHWGTSIAEEVADLMGKRLQWDEAERERQLTAYRTAVETMIAFRPANGSAGS